MAAEYNEQTTALTVVSEPEPFNQRQMQIIKEQIANGASDDELAWFVEVCRITGLNPLQRQIHAVMRNTKDAKGNWIKRMTIQTGIDGYRLIAARTGQLGGIDDPQYDTEDGDNPNRATVTVWRMVQGQRVPFTATARWREYVQTDKDNHPTAMWKKMPWLMLGKCAESLALRKAFPAELSGVYTAEEMSQADAVPEPVNTVPANSDGEFIYSLAAPATPAPARGKRVTPAASAPSWADLKARAATLGIDEANWPLTVQAWTGKAEGYTAQDKQTVRDRLDQRERMEASADLTQMGEMRV